MADVFLGYTYSDKGAAEQIVGALERDGRSVWWDAKLAPGDDFTKAISDAIHASNLVVILITPDAVQSKWVLAEISLAMDLGRLFPVLLGPALEDFLENHLPPNLRTLQLFHMRDLSDAELRRLSGAVAREVARRKATEGAPSETSEDARSFMARAGRALIDRSRIAAQGVLNALLWPVRALLRLRPPRLLQRWLRRAASALVAAFAVLGLLLLLEPYFEEAPSSAVVADVALVGGVERLALIEGREQVRIVEMRPPAQRVEEGARVGVVRGHGAEIVAASFVEGGAALETVDGAGHARRTELATLPWLSWPEREHLTAGGAGAQAWAFAGAPTLAALRSSWRAAECATGLGRWCPLTSFRETLAAGSPDEFLGPEMVVIPAGTFLMGSPEDEKGRTDGEGPQRIVSVPRFALARTEVTVAEYRRFVEETGHDGGTECVTLGSGGSWLDPGFDQSEEDPVVCVSWNDAQAYIAWLNHLTPGAPYRLPSEAEWEYAARAGSTTRYPFGDDEAPLGDHAWFLENSETRTRPVAEKRPNAFGLHDMLGNAMEWTEDCWHSSYTDAPRDGIDWRDASGGDCSRAVLRGGSWYNGARVLRSADRDWFWRVGRSFSFGFRLARTLPDD